MSNRKDLRNQSQQQNLKKYFDNQNSTHNIDTIRLGDRDSDTNKDNVVYPNNSEVTAGQRVFSSSLPIGVPVQATQPYGNAVVALNQRSYFEDDDIVEEDELDVYPFKVLFSLDIVTSFDPINGIQIGTSSLWIGGDTNTPTKILEVPLNHYFSPRINNLGKAKDNYIASVTFYTENNEFFGITGSFGKTSWQFLNTAQSSVTVYKGNGIWTSYLQSNDPNRTSTTNVVTDSGFGDLAGTTRITTIDDIYSMGFYPTSLGLTGGGIGQQIYGEKTLDPLKNIYELTEISYENIYATTASFLLYDGALTQASGNYNRNSSSVSSATKTPNATIDETASGEYSSNTTVTGLTFLSPTLTASYSYSNINTSTNNLNFENDIGNGHTIADQSNLILFGKNGNSFIVSKEYTDAQRISLGSNETVLYKYFIQYFLYTSSGIKEINNDENVFIKSKTDTIIVPGKDFINFNGSNIYISSTVLKVGIEVTISKVSVINNIKKYMTVKGIIQEYESNDVGVGKTFIGNILIKVSSIKNVKYDSFATENGTLWLDNGSLFAILFSANFIFFVDNIASNSVSANEASNTYQQFYNFMTVNLIEKNIFVCPFSFSPVSYANKNDVLQAEVWELQDDGNRLNCIRKSPISKKVKSLKIAQISKGQVIDVSPNIPGQVTDLSKSKYEIHSISYYPPK